MLQPVLLGLLAAFVGFASSFAVVLAGFAAMGASPEQAASGLIMLCVLMGVLGAGFSIIWRMPVSIAWSTPGAALLVTTGMPVGGFPAAAGAFLAASLLLVVAGLWRPFARAVERRLLNQGRDEARSLDETFDRAWDALCVLPRRPNCCALRACSTNACAILPSSMSVSASPSWRFWPPLVLRVKRRRPSAKKRS